MKEIWKDIKDYEGIYQVSNLGRVRSVDRLDSANHRLKGKLMKGYTNIKGYIAISLCKNGVSSTKKIHRLVAEAFIPNSENKTQVNHIDEDKANNVISNLEWTTAKQNSNHGTRNERMARTQSIPIIAINIKTCESQEFHGGRECARQLELKSSNITKVLKGKLNQTGGYTFKYKEV